MVAARLLFLVAAVAGEAVFEDSPTLSSMWQAASDGSTDAFINELIKNEDAGTHRSGDGRGPMFWAYEFKNVDTLALLLHLGVTTDQEDVGGQKPREFFPNSEDDELAEFEADAKSKIEELAALLVEREEEYMSYQNAGPDDDYDDDDEDDEDDEDEASATPKKAPPKVDEIDYADEDEDEEDGKDEM